MATIRLIPSSYGRSNTNYVTVTDPSNMYYNTDHTLNYCSIRGRGGRSTNSTYYAFINGFNFDDVPDNAQVSAFTVKIRCYRNANQSTGSSYRLRLASSASNNSVISGTTTSTDIDITQSVITIPTGSLTWSTLKNYGSGFSIEVPLRNTSTSSSQYPYVYVYGAEIEVTYTVEDVHVTSVSLNKNTLSMEEGDTEQLTETVLPANATDKSVSWSSSNNAVATVNSSGLVTAVSAGSATITVTTTDGGYTASCAVTVTQPSYTEYQLASTMTVGKTYIVADGNSGTVNMMSNESSGSRTLKGYTATVTNNKLQLRDSLATKCVFTCVQTVVGNSVTTTLEDSDGKYIYCDNASGLRFQSTGSLDRFWHYINTKFWQFKSSGSDGYSDTSSEYKYYLQVSNGNFTDNHVTTTSIEDSTLPAIYLFTPSSGTTDALFFKNNGNWVQATHVYKKVNGSWVEQSDLTNVFQSGVNYIKGN